MEGMMGIKSVSAAVLLGCALMLSACETDFEDRADAGATTDNSTVAIGAASTTLIGAITDPCKLSPNDPFWKRYGGEDSYAEDYERRCGHPPPD
jgi:hypothetical protein